MLGQIGQLLAADLLHHLPEPALEHGGRVITAAMAACSDAVHEAAVVGDEVLQADGGDAKGGGLLLAKQRGAELRSGVVP